MSSVRCRWPMADDRLPSTVYRLPSTVYRLPSTVYRLPSYRLPSYRLLFTVYLLSQHPARRCLGELSVEPYGHAVDEHVRHALGEFLRLYVGREIADGSRIEDYDVGECARTDHAAIGDAENGRRQAGHRPDRELQRHDVPLAHVHAQTPCECPVIARMRMPDADGDEAAIARRHRVRRAHDRHDVRFRHVERHDRRVSRRYQVDRDFDRTYVARFCNLRQRLSLE